MEDTIAELWHGNIAPQTDSRKDSGEMKELMGYTARHSEDLKKLLDDERREIFEKSRECRNRYVSLAAAAIFEYALRLGARLTLKSPAEDDLKRQHRGRCERSRRLFLSADKYFQTNFLTHIEKSRRFVL